MVELYFLYSRRMEAFVDKSSVGTSNIEEAARFTEVEAQARMLVSRDHDGNFQILPVPCHLMEIE